MKVWYYKNLKKCTIELFQTTWDNSIEFIPIISLNRIADDKDVFYHFEISWLIYEFHIGIGPV